MAELIYDRKVGEQHHLMDRDVSKYEMRTKYDLNTNSQQIHKTLETRLALCDTKSPKVLKLEDS